MNKQIISTNSPRTALEIQELEQMRRDMQQDVRRHYASRMVAVTIPFYQALISGLLAGILIAILIYAFGGSAKYILFGLLITWVVVTGIVWLILLSNWRELVWNMEAQLGMDLTGDQVIGRPGDEDIPIVEVWLNSTDGRQQQRAQLPASESELRQLAQGILLKNLLFTEDAWTGRGKLFSQGRFQELRQAFIEKGWASWIDPLEHRTGVQITPPGRAVLRSFTADLSVPSPTPRMYQ